MLHAAALSDSSPGPEGDIGSDEDSQQEDDVNPSPRNTILSLSDDNQNNNPRPSKHAIDDDKSDESDVKVLVPAPKKPRTATVAHVKAKHGPRKGASEKPTKSTVKKAFNPLDRLAEMSNAEEATTQKKLDLRQSRLNLEKELEKERIRVAGSTKVAKEKARVDFALGKLRLTQEHEYRMAVLAQGAPVASSSSSSSHNQRPSASVDSFSTGSSSTSEIGDFGGDFVGDFGSDFRQSYTGMNNLY